MIILIRISIGLMWAIMLTTPSRSEGVFDFMKVWVSEARAGVYCSLNGCDSTSVLAKRFEPGASREHFCKRAWMGGPPSVEVSICLVEAGGAISMEGDLVVVVNNRTSRRLEILADCSSSYVPGREFISKTVSSGPIGFTLDTKKAHDFYLLMAQLERVSRPNWRFTGTANCEWSVTEERPEPENPKKQITAAASKSNEELTKQENHNKSKVSPPTSGEDTTKRTHSDNVHQSRSMPIPTSKPEAKCPEDWHYSIGQDKCIDYSNALRAYNR